MSDLPDAPTIAALRSLYASGLDPRQVVADTYRRIAAADDPGIFISLVPEEAALAAAGTLGNFDPRTRPLWGVPFAIKDNIDLAGVPTTVACPGFAYRPAASAPAVARLVAAGALPIGKTNLDQFATGLVGLRTPYPAPRNPFDPAIVPGGSSSGSAVAVARGLISFALGTDTAGSGRVPAGLNNIVGLKPTKGAVSVRGVVPACWSLDCVSVFALTVDDATAVFRVIAGFDADDPLSRELPAAPPLDAVGLCVGVPNAAGRRFAGDALAERAFAASIAGLDAIEVDIEPLLVTGDLVYRGPFVAERYQAVGDFIAKNPEAAHPVVRDIILASAKLSAADAFAGLYRLAERRRAAEAVWRAVDILVVPTFPRPVRVAEALADPIGPNAMLGTYTNFVNLLDLCALAVPGRLRDDGFPSGLTLIAPAGCDERLTALGAALHAGSEVPLGANLR